MAKNREAVTCNGRAAFYAAMWEDIRQCAMDHGWAVALHGSLASDMDIMAMPWVSDSVSFAELVKAIRLLFTGNHMHGTVITYNEKPHGRIVATIPIWADFYLDISTMDAEEVVHGEWGEIYTCHGEQLWGYRCSQCEQDNSKKSNYCPNCGAKMDGGNEDGNLLFADMEEIIDA